jgi:hypothetical protein
MKKHTQSFSAVALGIGSLLLAASAQAMDFGNMMNPSKWMGGGNNDRNSHYGGGPGYGGPVYGYGGGPGGYGGGPGYGYGGGPGGYGGGPGYGYGGGPAGYGGGPGYGYGGGPAGYGGGPGYGYGGPGGYR